MKSLSRVTIVAQFVLQMILGQGGLTGVTSWAYQLQNITLSEIINNHTFELLVMDYSQDGTDEIKFSPDEIAQIKESGKIPVAYISIGEAEDYRFYWKDEWLTVPPSWLGPKNPDWEGNYKVRFWDPEWQAIVFSYVDTIISQGFEGIYCDIIDAYYYWSEENPEKSEADSLMVRFVLNIRDHISETTDKPFHLIPQNGEFIIEEPNVTEALSAAYFEAIDAIGVEDVFFPGDLDNDNPYEPDEERLAVLENYLANEKPVFSVEYLTDTVSIDKYLSVAQEYNFVPYVTTRDLDVLNDGITLSIGDDDKSLLQSIRLLQNYPNPFNSATVIEYRLQKRSPISLTIFNIRGQRIVTLIDDIRPQGNYQFLWKPAELSSGVYFIRLEIGSMQMETVKVAYLK